MNDVNGVMLPLRLNDHSCASRVITTTCSSVKRTLLRIAPCGSGASLSRNQWSEIPWGRSKSPEDGPKNAIDSPPGTRQKGERREREPPSTVALGERHSLAASTTTEAAWPVSTFTSRLNFRR